MATKTKNYGLNKHSPDDFYSVEARNENWDKIDEALASSDPAKAAAKSEPEAEDGVLLSDSAASGGLKRLSWAAVKNALGKVFVPLARKVNGKGLGSDVTLTAADVGAVPISGGEVKGALGVANLLAVSQVSVQNWGNGEAMLVITDRNGGGERYLSINDKTREDSFESSIRYVEHTADNQYTVYNILHDGNGVQKSGDTMTGLLGLGDGCGYVNAFEDTLNKCAYLEAASQTGQSIRVQLWDNKGGGAPNAGIQIWRQHGGAFTLWGDILHTGISAMSLLTPTETTPSAGNQICWQYG